MATKDVHLNPTGSSVEVEVRCGQAQEGAYVLTLWDGNTKVARWEGNFLNTDDDKYTLPGDASEQDGRILQCKFEIGITPPITRYHAEMEVMQNGTSVEILDESGDGAGRNLVPVNLFGNLK